MSSQLSLAPNKQKLYFFILFSFFIFISLQESILPDLETNNQYQKIYRKLVKAQNSRKIQQFNQDQAHAFKLQANNFLSLTNQQFLSIYTTNVKIQETKKSMSLSFNSLKESQQSHLKGASHQSNIKFQPSKCESVNIDWSRHASPVKQQGKCESCYAHSTLATIESMMHLDYGIMFDLSEQQITQCTINWAPEGFQHLHNKGCQGGWGWKSLLYILNFGVTLQKYYPYTLGQNPTVKSCQKSTIEDERFKITGYKKYYNRIWPQSQCNILNERLEEGKTIAVSIWVPSGIQFQFYGSASPDIDIWNICGNYDNVNHELQLVGSTDRYWKLKNSYGVGWGEKGYLYLDKSRGLNCLNICMDFSFPTGLPVLK